MWRISLRIILILVIAAVIGGMIVILASYRYWLKPSRLMESKIESHVDIGLKKVHHVAMKNGRKLWDLHTSSVSRILDQSHFSPLTVTLYPHTGNPITMTGEHGYVTDNKNIEVSGNIRIKQPPWNFLCNSLTYSFTRHHAIGRDHIAVTGNGITMTAETLHYDLSSGVLTMSSTVALTVNRMPKNYP